MDARQSQLLKILRAVAQIRVPNPKMVVSIGAIWIETFDCPFMIAYGKRGHLWFCSIEEGIPPILLLGAVFSYFGPVKIKVNEWEPIHVRQMADLSLEIFEEYVRELGRLSGSNGAPVNDLRTLFEKWRVWEDEQLAAKSPPPYESVLYRSMERDIWN